MLILYWRLAKDNVEHMTRHPAPIIARFYPAMVNAFPSSVHQSGLDLANRNILWTSVKSIGIKIPLPIDSCCSISLVSKKHADLVSQNCPDLKIWYQTGNPLSVSVASAESKFQAVGMMQIPIVWQNGAGGMTPSVPLSFYKQFLPLPKSRLLLPSPHPSPCPLNKNFGRRLDFAWTSFCINFCSY